MLHSERVRKTSQYVVWGITLWLAAVMSATLLVVWIIRG